MLFTCITVVYSDDSTTPTDNTALLQIQRITEGNSAGVWTGVVNTVRLIPYTVGKWQSAGGAIFPMTGHWQTSEWVFPCDQTWRCRVGLQFLEDFGAYVGWSFCRAEMSRGGGALPLHSFSCPSLKRRLRAGKGTPDSAWGWLRGFETPLSMSEGWMPSCQHRGENHRSKHQTEQTRQIS